MPKRILHGNYSEIVELIYTYHSWHILYGINYRDNTILEMPNISFALPFLIYRTMHGIYQIDSNDLFQFISIHSKHQLYMFEPKACYNANKNNASTEINFNVFFLSQTL